MKAITWLATITVGVGAFGARASAAATSAAASVTEPKIPAASGQTATLEGWSADFDQALATAKTEKKCVLVEFTGSDWCPPCIAMRKNVFAKPEFVTAASKNFILVELDFPKGDKELADKNQPLARKYKITGFPTVVLLDPAGKEFTRFFASQFPQTEDFLKHLDESLEKKDLD